MLILAARYTFFFWLYIGGSSAEKLLLTQIVAADEEIFRLSSCTAQCLSTIQHQSNYSRDNNLDETTTPQDIYQREQHSEHKGNLQSCFDRCHLNNSAETIAARSKHDGLRKIPENFHFFLICRDDRSLTFRIDFASSESVDEGAFRSSVAMQENATVQLKFAVVKPTPQSIKLQKELRKTEENIVFFIRINSAADYENYRVYLTDDRVFTIANLTQDRVYNLTVVAAHTNNEYSVITQKEQFATLRAGYMPGTVRDLRVVEFSTMDDEIPEIRLLKAKIVWKPAIDMTCHYNIICFSTETDDMSPFEIRNPNHLFTYEIDHLAFSKEYRVGIRGKNTNNDAKESDFRWVTFRAPSCVDLYNYNFNICAPLEPRGLTVQKMYLSDHDFALNISWEKPEYLPDYYVLKVLDMSEKANPYSQNVSKYQNNVFIDRITLRGFMYEVYLVAYSLGGQSAVSTGDVTEILVNIQDKSYKAKMISAIFAPVFCIFILSLTMFMICQRRAKLKRYQDRCKYFEALEKKADAKANFDFGAKSLPKLCSADELQKHLQFDLEEKGFLSDDDDSIEIDRSDVTLYEVLGEGAFGLVRRGQFHNRKSGEKKEVAVKMLKEQPSIDDIRAFRREIEVMKSVERHPNIVGILGHCTRRSTEMLLLTEYCSLGSLLDFLRNEWKYLHDLQTRTILMQAAQNGGTSRNKQSDLRCSSSLRLAAINMSYGYDEICTNSCKNQVEILVRGNETQRNVNSSLESKNLDHEIKSNLVTVKDCECPAQRQQRQQKQVVRKNPGTASMRIQKNYIQDALVVESKEYFDPIIDEKPHVDTQQQQQQQQQPRQCQQVGERLTEILVPRIPLSGSDLLDIAQQVATGMEFLAKNKVVHRDLAARNVLVATDRTIKIADFGLSRDIYQENMYKKCGNGKLPIKWLALESMTHQVYTTQSDVWSYGILLYEIATLGGSPYPAIPTNRLLHLLKSGYRMEKPKNCGREFCDLMLSCWHANPGERPTFPEIIKLLDGFINDSGAQQISTATIAIAPTRKEDMKPTQSLSDDAYLKPL